jgi:cytoskeletal protein RodZ
VKNIGGLLSAAREEKGYTISDVTRETNIARKYIVALEAEEFGAFPAEAYIIGFLKNYGEFLGLDAKTLLDQYRVLKIQEQSVPLSELLSKPSRFPRFFIMPMIIIVSVGLIAGIVFFAVSRASHSPPIELSPRKPIEYLLNNGFLEQRFFLGDSIVIPSGEGQYKLGLESLGETVVLSTPNGRLDLDLNQEALLDTNEDDVPELRISVSDYAKNNADTGVLLRLELNEYDARTLPSNTQNAITGSNSGEANPGGAASMTGVTGGEQLVWTGNNPYPFTLQISFQGNCMFRWEILREADRQLRNERYFVRGDQLDIQAQNGIRLWISNAGSIKIQAIGGGRTVPLEIGAAGEVVVSDVLWRRGEDGRYSLVQTRLEN